MNVYLGLSMVSEYLHSCFEGWHPLCPCLFPFWAFADGEKIEAGKQKMEEEQD
jgi:hypothetical protein